MCIIVGLEQRLSPVPNNVRQTRSRNNHHRFETRSNASQRRECFGNSPQTTTTTTSQHCTATWPDQGLTQTTNTQIHSDCVNKSSLVIAKNEPRLANLGLIRTMQRKHDHHHNHHHQHFHKPRRHQHSNRISYLTSIQPLTLHRGNFSFSRMIIASLTTQSLIYRTFLMLVIILALSSHSFISGLDSPVKVQRNKQLQLQQQQQQQQQPSNASWPISSELQQPPTDEVGASTAAAINPKIDRVRRTNPVNEQSARINQQQQASQQQRECPSNRLIQGLLPPEYAGSPATSQRPSMARATCECQADPLGWRLTCFAGSLTGATGIQGAGRTPGGSSAPSMPNQLHPAFRSSQVARQQQQQQQQQQQSAAGRRNRRSPLDSGNPATASGHDADESSPHEGFGEELATATDEQLARLNNNKPALQKQRDPRAQQQRQIKQQNRQETANYITNFSNDQQQQRAGQTSNSNQDTSGEQDRLMSATSSVHSQHLTFQPVPVLFAVNYLRNNMIEIDCDQSVPNYKAAMFRDLFEAKN